VHKFQQNFTAEVPERERERDGDKWGCVRAIDATREAHKREKSSRAPLRRAIIGGGKKLGMSCSQKKKNKRLFTAMQKLT